jgi:drug/metabolite transporter (DMT)-like permease
MLGLAFVCTGLAFIVFFRLIDEVGPARAGLITFANPVVAIALGSLFLDEVITVATVIGFLLVIIGCWLATRPPPSPNESHVDAPVLAVSGAHVATPPADGVGSA